MSRFNGVARAATAALALIAASVSAQVPNPLVSGPIAANATDQNLADGFITPADAEATVSEAARSAVGRY